MSIDGSAERTPGHWPEPPCADARPGGAVPTWRPRALLLAALLFGAWALVVGWPSAAQADEPATATPLPCEVAGLPDPAALLDPADPAALCPPPVPGPGAPAAADAELPAPSEPVEPVVPPAPSEPIEPVVAPAPSEPVEPVTPPAPSEPIEPVASPAPSEPVETVAPPSTPPGDDAPENEDTGDVEVAVPVDAPAIGTTVESPVAETVADPAPVTTAPDATGADTTAPEPTTTGTGALREVPAVPSGSTAREPACAGMPLPADEGRRIGPADTRSGTRGHAAAVAHTPVAGDGSTPPAAVPPGGTPPGSPAPPLAPAGLPSPLPAPAPAPAGSSAAVSSGSSGCGPGQSEHADLTDAVLGGGWAADVAQASVRPSQGFAGAVVGGADDPGVRPG